ncbi:hypothetical protein [Niallia sp. Krafla_26]|uniref:hypothetical protein n=1 Tax=Niallia sp. Krafla_26 TaxID=3064703 RepID=UPI003D16D901
MNNNEENYLYITSLDTTDNPEDFIIELYDLPEAQDEPLEEPIRVIHNFDELILFLEEFDVYEHEEIEKSVPV